LWGEQVWVIGIGFMATLQGSGLFNFGSSLLNLNWIKNNFWK